jgi:hypothetical protein
MMVMSLNNESYGTYLVETETDVVTVQSVSMKLLVEKVLLESSSDSGLSISTTILNSPVQICHKERKRTFPEADNPVSQIVAPFWFKSSDRSSSLTAPSWKVMLVAIVMND